MKQSSLKIILFVAFVDLVGFGLIIPLQASYADRLGASGFVFGLLIGVYAAMQFVFNPLLGRWSDRIGRRPVLIVSIAGSVISHLLLGFADLSASLPLLFVARMLDGITGANIATAQAYIADVTTHEDRARGMGLFGAAFGFGFVIGPALGAALVTLGYLVSGPQYGTSWPAFGAAVIALIALVLVWRYLPESHRPGDAVRPSASLFTLARLKAAFAHPRLRELYLLMFWATFAFVLLEVSFVYLCRHQLGLQEGGIGLMFAYFGMMMVVVQGGLVGRLARRFGEARTLSAAPFITAVGFLIIAAVPIGQGGALGWVLLMGGCVPTALGHGLTGPNINALISRQAQKEKQGATLGLSQGIGSLARALAPPIGGLLYVVGPAVPYLVGALLLGGIGVLAMTIRAAQERTLKKEPGAQDLRPDSPTAC